MSKKVYAHIMGGIGNQFFIYFSSYFFSKRNKAKLLLDINSTKILDLRFKQKMQVHKLKNAPENCSLITSAVFILYRIINKIYKLPDYISIKFFKIKFSFFNDIKQKFSENFFLNYKMSNNERVYLIGYWQNIKYINFTKIPNLDLNFKKKQISINSKTVAIHIRGKDRINSRSLHRLASDNFYKKAIKELSKFKIDFNYHIFTDNKNYANKVLKKLNIRKKIYIETKINNDLEQFLHLTNYKYYVISNSTFSLLPALINKIKSKIILAENLWIRNKFPKRLLVKQIKLLS